MSRRRRGVYWRAPLCESHWLQHGFLHYVDEQQTRRGKNDTWQRCLRRGGCCIIGEREGAARTVNFFCVILTASAPLHHLDSRFRHSRSHHGPHILLLPKPPCSSLSGSSFVAHAPAAVHDDDDVRATASPGAECDSEEPDAVSCLVNSRVTRGGKADPHATALASLGFFVGHSPPDDAQANPLQAGCTLLKRVPNSGRCSTACRSRSDRGQVEA